MEAVVEGLSCVGGLLGVSDAPHDSSKRLLEESGFVFFVLLVD